jgi:hypothetical protein
MMQQQLLLIILAIILVGTAAAIGLTMTNDHASSSNRDAVGVDLIDLAGKAQHFYRRPAVYGGGGRSFDGLTIDRLTQRSINENGRYEIVGSAAGQGPVRLRGVGNQRGTDGITNVNVEVLVWPDSITVDVTAMN